MGKRVLVCEDDRAIRLLFDRLLSRRGLTAECVGTGAEAVSLLRRHDYELILLDLLVPVVSGFEVVALLRRERPHLLDRVIVVTACLSALREPLPVAAVLCKPFDIADLDRAVDRVLSHSSLREPPQERSHREGAWR